MSLYGMMRTSVSGMAAQASRLATVADNIANSATTGYKRSGTEFQTQVLNSNSGNYNSGSVGTTIRTDISRQGSFKASSSPTDLAISGAGFFLVQDGSGDTFLTRAGSFLVDSQGNLVNSSGNKLLGYDVASNTNTQVANGFAGLVPVNIGLQSLNAVATTEGTLLPNLPSNAAITLPGSLPSDNVATSQSAGKTSLVTYDSLGNERTVDVYFAKTSANNWEVSVYNAADSTAGTFPYSSGAIAQTNLTFDPSTGYISGGGSTTLNIPISGGAIMALDMTGISQLGSGYQVLTAQTNGSSPASIERVEIDSDGTVYGIFQNGFSRPVYKLALATVPSPDNLKALPGNVYSATIDSGDVLVGSAETKGFGGIVANALEESNVDMATELTVMIESQRTYTANSKVFQTGSDLMDVLVNLKR